MRRTLRHLRYFCLRFSLFSFAFMNKHQTNECMIIGIINNKENCANCNLLPVCVVCTCTSARHSPPKWVNKQQEKYKIGWIMIVWSSTVSSGVWFNRKTARTSPWRPGLFNIDPKTHAKRFRNCYLVISSSHKRHSMAFRRRPPPQRTYWKYVNVRFHREINYRTTSKWQ